MARYDYKCPQCETTFEVEHPMSERPEVRCPTCGSVATQVFGTAGIVFKGSGFYNTDQRHGTGSTQATGPSTQKKESPSEGTGTKTESSSEGTGTKTETKPSTTSDSSAKKAD